MMNKKFQMKMNAGAQGENKVERDAEQMAQVFASKLPKFTNFNNSKSNKYFSNKNPNATKFHNQSSSPYNNGFNSLTESNELNGMMTIKDTLIHNCKRNLNAAHVRNPSNVLRVSKEILKFAERKSTPKVFYKIPAKLVEDDVLSEEDEETTDKEDSLTNRTTENIKPEMKDSVVEAKQQIKEKLNNTDIEIVKKKSLTEMLAGLDYSCLWEIEGIYKEIGKILETGSQNFLNKLENDKDNNISPSKDDSHKMRSKLEALILKYFQCTNNIVKILDNLSENEHIKEFDLFFSLEILVFSLCERLIYYKSINAANYNYIQNAFKNCLFYSHQNFIIFLFVSTGEPQTNNYYKTPLSKPPRSKENNDSNLASNSTPFLDECKQLIEGNRTWLNKNNYKKFLRSNNKTIKTIIQNLLKKIKTEEIFNNPKNTTLNKIITYFLKNLGKYKPSKVKSEISLNLFSSDEHNDETSESESCIDQSEYINPDLKNESYLNPPFLPQIKNDKVYTLVLDLDETLVHYVEDEESAYIQIRPGTENFLDEMAEFFEIVVFTAAMQDVIYC